MVSCIIAVDALFIASRKHKILNDDERSIEEIDVRVAEELAIQDGPPFVLGLDRNPRRGSPGMVEDDGTRVDGTVVPPRNCVHMVVGAIADQDGIARPSRLDAA